MADEVIQDITLKLLYLQVSNVQICKKFIKGKEKTQMRNQASPNSKLNKGRVISEHIFNLISPKKCCSFALDFNVE